MPTAEQNVVTGAFGYTGRRIASRLLDLGETVKTLTNKSQQLNTFGDRVQAFPLNFADPAALVEVLRGAATFYITYWIRFPYRGVDFAKAVQNTMTLFDAAKEAGVRRVVYVSVTNPSEDLSLPYFSGKARLEEALKSLGLSYAIIRPTVIFAHDDILVNNIAWLLRRFPLFPIPGSGKYKIQPVYVEDMADLMVKAGHQNEDIVIDAVGPETFTYEEMVRLIADKVGGRAKIVHVPPGLALASARLMGLFLRDVVLTRDEIEGLMRGLLVSDPPPTCHTRLSDWLEENSDRVGGHYASELARRT